MKKNNNLGAWTLQGVFNFVCFDYLRPSQQLFSHVRTGLPGLNEYEAEYNVFLKD